MQCIGKKEEKVKTIRSATTQKKIFFNTQSCSGFYQLQSMTLQTKFGCRKEPRIRDSKSYKPLNISNTCLGS